MTASSTASPYNHPPAEPGLDRAAPGPPALRRTFPVAALATALLILLFEAGFVWQFRYHLWDANYILLEKKRTAMQAQTPPDDLAILGSSRFYHVQPAPLATLMGPGARVTNYAWGHCGVEAYEAMLRGLIHAGRAPKTILVDGMPEVFGYRSDLLSITDSDGLRIGLTATAPMTAATRMALGQKEWHTAWQIIAQHLTPPSTLYRDALRPAMKNLLRTGNLPPLPPEYDSVVAAWQRQGWFYFAPPNHRAASDEFEMLHQHTGPYKLRENRHVTRAYERFVRLARDHKIEVILLATPNNQLVYDTFTREGIYARYNEWLSHMERRYANFHAPGPRWFCWPGLLGDPLHVNAEGAAKHMDFIVKQLQELRLPSPR